MFGPGQFLKKKIVQVMSNISVSSRLIFPQIILILGLQSQPGYNESNQNIEFILASD